jgi:hypothetical protein
MPLADSDLPREQWNHCYNVHDRPAASVQTLGVPSRARNTRPLEVQGQDRSNQLGFLHQRGRGRAFAAAEEARVRAAAGRFFIESGR